MFLRHLSMSWHLVRLGTNVNEFASRGRVQIAQIKRVRAASTCNSCSSCLNKNHYAMPLFLQAHVYLMLRQLVSTAAKDLCQAHVFLMLPARHCH